MTTTTTFFVFSSSVSPTTSIFDKDGITSLYGGIDNDLTNPQVLTNLGLTAIADPTNTATTTTNVLIASVDQEGIWTSSWISESDYKGMLNTQIKEASVRRQRDILLQACDWTQGKDVPDATSNKWVEYRQALRDVTSQEGFPLTITWPVSP